MCLIKGVVKRLLGGSGGCLVHNCDASPRIPQFRFTVQEGHRTTDCNGSLIVRAFDRNTREAKPISVAIDRVGRHWNAMLDGLYLVKLALRG